MVPTKPQYRRADQVLEILRTMLNSPEYPAGTKLAPERELASLLETSRRSLRQALDTLEAEKQLERVPGRGTIVLNPTTSVTSVNEVIQHTSPLELMDARFVLEPAIATAAAIHATAYDLDRISNFFDKTLQAQTHEEWEKWDAKFHESLGEATHNHLLQHFYTVLTEARQQTQWGQLRKKALTAEVKTHYIKQHKEILDAIHNRNPDQAAQAMRAHLSAIRKNLLEPLAKNT